MKKIIRLENTGFGFPALDEEEIDKVLDFSPLTGELLVHQLDRGLRIAFGESQDQIRKKLQQAISCDFSPKSTVIIHNRPIVGAYSAPFKVYLDINTACQSKCSFCLSAAQKSNDFLLPIAVVEKIASEVSRLGIMYIKIGGGDPFLHPDFKQIVSLLTDAGSFVTVSTNSLTLTRQMADFLAERRVRVSVSLEGLEKTDNELRCPGHFKKAIEAMSLLKSVGAQAIFRTTLLRENLSEVPLLVELAKSIGSKIRFCYCRPIGRAVTNKTVLNYADREAYFKAIAYLNREDVLPHVVMDEGMMFYQPPEIVGKLYRKRMCGAANRSMHINSFGTVSPCIFLGQDYYFGRLYEDATISEFWRGEFGDRFAAVRLIKEPSECQNCKRMCKYECLANRLYTGGSFSCTDPNCLRAVQGKEV